MSDPASDAERLRALVLEHLHVDVPSPDADLLESGVLDSLQLVDLLLLIEQHFGQRIPIESIELDDLRSLGRIARLLRPAAAPAPGAASGDDGAVERAQRLEDSRAAQRDGVSRRG